MGRAIPCCAIDRGQDQDHRGGEISLKSKKGYSPYSVAAGGKTGFRWALWKLIFLIGLSSLQ